MAWCSAEEAETSRKVSGDSHLRLRRCFHPLCILIYFIYFTNGDANVQRPAKTLVFGSFCVVIVEGELITAPSLALTGGFFWFPPTQCGNIPTFYCNKTRRTKCLWWDTE